MENSAERCQAELPAGSSLRAEASSFTQQDWLYRIVRILDARPLGLHIAQLELLLWHSQFPGIAMPAPFRIQVQSILSRYSSQSVVFRQRKTRPADDLFYSPEGKGSGMWATRRPHAQAWLRRRRDPVMRQNIEAFPS